MYDFHFIGWITSEGESAGRGGGDFQDTPYAEFCLQRQVAKREASVTALFRKKSCKALFPGQSSGVVYDADARLCVGERGRFIYNIHSTKSTMPASWHIWWLRAHCFTFQFPEDILRWLGYRVESFFEVSFGQLFLCCFPSGHLFRMSVWQ